MEFVNLNSSLTAAQKDLYQNPETIRKILNESRTIAIVGLSADQQKASNMVAVYLRSAGYRIIPVNPNAKTIFGEKSYPDLASFPEHIDLVNIFRPAADCLKIVEEAISCKAGAVWLQLRIINLEAAKLALEAGLPVVMDLCTKIEHQRYCGGLHGTE
jgi:uncharacterized protein